MRTPPPPAVPVQTSTDELRRRIKAAISDFLKGRRKDGLEVYERRGGKTVRR
ncbi:MAG: hypothetical protein JWM53_3352 [bacterium]|nr:hypothetical protein [bacterium]